MKTVDWYFDVISPYSYLQSTRLTDLARRVQLRCRPVLFAGLLEHWGNVGPAEIMPKRTWTFRHCAWLARRHGILMTIPSEHPFNPLPLLRLGLALGEDGVVSVAVTERLFAFVWREGHIPSEEGPWRELLRELQVDTQQVADPAVKDALRRNGETAISQGVFGVPTSVVDGIPVWGFESNEMLDALIDGDTFR